MKTSDKLLKVDTYGILASLKLHDRTYNRATVDGSKTSCRLVLPLKISEDIRNKMSYPVLLKTVTRHLARDIKHVVHMGDIDSHDPMLMAMDGTKKRGWQFSDANIYLDDFQVTKTKARAPYGMDYFYIISIRVGIEHKATTAEHDVAAQNL